MIMAQMWGFLLTIWSCLWISRTTCASLIRACDFFKHQHRQFYMKPRPHNRVVEFSQTPQFP